MKAALIAALIFSGYWIVDLNDQNIKFKETLTGELWCEIHQDASTSWKHCKIVDKQRLDKQVARIEY